MENKPRRRWLRFSLRTVFVVIALLAIPLGWAGYQLNWVRQRRAVIRNAYWERDREDRFAPEMLWLFGEVGYSGVWLIEPATVEQVERAKVLFPDADTVATHAPPIIRSTIEEVEKELFKQFDELRDRRDGSQPEPTP